MEVHRELGQGFLEAVYQEAVALEFRSRGIPFSREVELKIFYKEEELRNHYQVDFVCFVDVIVELKALKQLTSIEANINLLLERYRFQDEVEAEAAAAEQPAEQPEPEVVAPESPPFHLHPRLEKGGLPLGTLMGCRVLLKNNALFPWIILVPEVAEGIEDLHQLDLERYREVTEAIRLISGCGTSFAILPFALRMPGIRKGVDPNVSVSGMPLAA